MITNQAAAYPSAWQSNFALGAILAELMKFEPLVMALVARHLAARYRRSVLGVLWSFLNPLCLVLVYVVVFKYFIRFNQVENYALFMVCGLLPWIWISSALSEGTSSIVSSGHLVTKSMFPPHLLVAVSVLTSMVHFLLALPILLGLIVWYGQSFYASLLLIPVLVFGQAVFLLGLALATASINVRYRDMQHIVANLLSFLFFLCPVVYPLEVVPQQFQPLLKANPLALLIKFYHEIILYGRVPATYEVLYFSAFALLTLLAGAMIYQRSREVFAELL